MSASSGDFHDLKSPGSSKIAHFEVVKIFMSKMLDPSDSTDIYNGQRRQRRSDSVLVTFFRDSLRA